MEISKEVRDAFDRWVESVISAPYDSGSRTLGQKQTLTRRFNFFVRDTEVYDLDLAEVSSQLMREFLEKNKLYDGWNVELGGIVEKSRSESELSWEEVGVHWFGLVRGPDHISTVSLQSRMIESGEWEPRWVWDIEPTASDYEGGESSMGWWESAEDAMDDCEKQLTKMKGPAQ